MFFPLMTEALALCDGESAQCLGSIARAELHVDAITLVIVWLTDKKLKAG